MTMGSMFSYEGHYADGTTAVGSYNKWEPINMDEVSGQTGDSIRSVCFHKGYFYAVDKKSRIYKLIGV